MIRVFPALYVDRRSTPRSCTRSVSPNSRSACRCTDTSLPQRRRWLSGRREQRWLRFQKLLPSELFERFLIATDRGSTRFSATRPRTSTVQAHPALGAHAADAPPPAKRQMNETTEDLARLQALLDQSNENAGRHLREVITPERRLSARTSAPGWRHAPVGPGDCDRGRAAAHRAGRRRLLSRCVQFRLFP